MRFREAATRVRTLFKKLISGVSGFSLFLGLLVVIPLTVVFPSAAQAATADKCDGTSTQNNIKVTAVHGKIFYIDTGQNQNVDAAYTGYKVDTTGTARNNVWVRVDSFAGSVVSLSNPLDQELQMGNMVATDNQMAYFLMKANRATSLAQSHVVRVYTGKPGTSGSSELYSCTFSFIKVAETIKAAANKVNSITPSVTSLVLGSTMTVEVKGFTGTIGQGSTLDGTIMWVSPAARSSWPSNALRLEATTFSFYNNKQYKSTVNNATFNDQLFVKTLTNGTSLLGGKYYYKAVYTFRIVGQTAAAAVVAPISQISSGTQIKHTDMSGLPSTSLATNSVRIDAEIVKTASTTATFGSSKMTFAYTISLKNYSSAGAIVFDQIIDVTSPSLTFTGTPQVGGVNYPSPNKDSAGNWIFSTPITVNAAPVGGVTTVLLTYSMIQVSNCVPGDPFAYTNQATGKIGSVTIGSSTITLSGVQNSGTCGTTTVVVDPVTTTLPPEASTQSPTSISTTGATLNALVDPNGTGSLPVVFELATNAALTTATTISLSATTTSSSPYAVNASAGTLTPGTTYYYRIKVGTGTSAVYGAILSFTTPEAPANPDAVTTSATNITSTSPFVADLNGTIDANAVVGGAGARSQYGSVTLNGDGSCPTPASITTVTVNDPDTGAALNLTSSSPTDVTQNITGLTLNTYYCYRIVATYSTSSVVNGAWVAFRAAAMTAQTITYSVPTFPSPNTTVMSLNSTQSSTATTTSGLTITYTSNTPDICTVSSSGTITSTTSGAGGTCSITASQGGNTAYYPALPVTISFQVVGQVILTYNANNATSGSAPAAQTVTAGGSLTVATPDAGLVRTGFTFAGWNTSSSGTGTTYLESSSITLTSNTTLFAMWKATITYNGNTNTSGAVPDSQVAVEGTIALRLNSNSLVKTGYLLAGWNTQANGLGARYGLGNDYVLTGDVTLYAEWVRDTDWRITYFGKGNNGGTVPDFADVTKTSPYTVSNSAPTRTGWTFTGWNTAENYSGTQRLGGATFTPTANVNLYAQWQGSVTYDLNGGSGTTPTSFNKLEGQSFTTNAGTGLTKTYYTFGSWNSQADGLGDTYLKNTAYNFTGTITLYAVWIPNDITITFDDNLSGGSHSADYTQVIPADTDTRLTAVTFSPTGSVFLGWSTTSARATAKTIDYADQGVVKFVATTTLYAAWSVEYTVSYRAGTGGIVTGDVDQVLGSGQTTSSVTAVPDTGYYFTQWNDSNSTASRTDTASANVTYTASFALKVSPYINWSNPTGITYGTALSNTQLNATVQETSSNNTAVEVTCVYTPASTTILAVGTQTLSVTCTPTNSNKYETVSTTVSIVVSARPITITADAKSKAYGESDPSLTYQITSGSLVGSDAVSGALSRSTGENVGTYTINRNTIAISANYTITYVSANLTIGTKAVTVTATAKTKVYGETDPSLTYSITSGALVGSDAFTGALTRDPGSNVGTYTITRGTLALSSNYAFTYVSANLTITAKPITVTGDILTKNSSDSDPTLTYQITAGGPLIGSDAFSGTAARAPGTSVGDYAITQGDVAISSNYLITWVNGKLTITNKIVPYILWNNPSNFTYGTLLGATQLNAVLKVSSGGANLDGTCVYTPALNTLLDAGSHTLSVTCTPTDGTTYSNKTTTVTIVVEPAQLTVTVTASNKPYDTSRSASVTPGSLLGKVGSDDVSLTVGKITGLFADATSANGKTVTLTISANPLEGAKAGNYILSTPANPTANITKVTVNVTAQGQSVVAGSNLATLAFVVASLVGGETGDPFTGVTCSTDYTTSDSAGTSRSITCTGGTATNYLSNHVAGSVTITSAAPTNYTITYETTNSDGGNAPANTTGNGSVTLRSNSGNLTRSGYTFGGWNTGTGCSGTNYAANASYTLGSNITLYPCWNLISPPPSDPEPQPRNNVAAKVKPVVVWKNPNAIKTTTVLSTTQLNAVATTSSSVTLAIANPAMPDKLPSTAPTIAGKYVYTPIVTTVVTAGVNQVTTITSAANALTGTTKTVETTTTPSIPNNTTSTTNIEEKPVLGQGTSLAPGLQKMKVVFIPTDSATYEPVETVVEILVQAETKVEWVEPAPIKKNTPVGPAQLNATGSAPGISNNVPGTYKYDIPEGQTFAPGKYPVKVIFTPTDPNYLPSETTTTITVIADINPLATPIVTPSNTPAAKPITNTTSGAKTTILSIGSGLSSAATSGTQVSVLPISTFSGKTSVRVAVTDEGETKEVDVPVTVLPLPAVAPVATPNTKGQSTINWKPSVNAIQYEVTLAGKTICTTNATSCSTNALIGPKSEVIVIAKGNDETVSPVAPAKYTAPKKPVTALVVYFDTNKFNLDAKDKADIRAVAKIIIEQGFKNIVVNGHTDIRGGVDNQVLSRNRSNSTFDYLKSLVPGLNVTIGAFASTKPAVKGSSAAALASNRRAEVGVF